MLHYEYFLATLGGLLIGTAAVTLLWFNGRIAGTDFPTWLNVAAGVLVSFISYKLVLQRGPVFEKQLQRRVSSS